MPVSKFFVYVMRWQLSTPILWLAVRNLGTGLEATVIANLIGASIFFWVDRFIFRARATLVEWEVAQTGICSDCQSLGRVRRLVLAPRRTTGSYDRREDEHPEFRCPRCSVRKLTQLRLRKQIAAGVSA